MVKWKLVSGNYSGSLSCPGWHLLIENLTLHGYLKLTLSNSRVVPDDYGGERERLEWVVSLAIAHNPEGFQMLGSLLKGQMEPGVLADWLEERQEQWSVVGNGSQIIEVLRL